MKNNKQESIIELMQTAYDWGDHWDDAWAYVYQALVDQKILRPEFSTDILTGKFKIVDEKFCSEGYKKRFKAILADIDSFREETK